MSRTQARPSVLGVLVAAALVAAAAIAVPARAQAPAAEVDVFNFDYAPKTVTIEVGQTVRWTGTQGNHTVTADDGSFDSMGFGSGETFEQTFDEVGIYEYFCRFHSSADAPLEDNQNGVITVVAAGEGPPEEPTDAPTEQPTSEPIDEPASADPADVDGTDPVATALAWSALLPDGGTTTAFIGTAGTFPDSLASGPGQGILDAPLLLTPTDALDDAVATELQRLGVSRVIILGGTAAISEQVQAQLAEVDGVQTVERAEGADRRETSRAVADLVAPDATTIILARQDGEGTAAFADSLAAGAVGASNGWPVVLVASTVDDALAAWLQGRQPTSIILAGGTAAIPQAVEDQLTDAGHTVSRFAGASRTGTAANLHSLTDPGDRTAPRVIVDGFGDLAWASGFAAALHGQGGLLLARSTSDTLPGETYGSLQGAGVDVICGPTLSDEACRQADLISAADFSTDGSLVAVMDDEQEVEAELTGASGVINLYPVGDAFCTLSFLEGLSGPIAAAHVHQGAFGEAGGVVLGLNLSASEFGPVYGCSAAEGASATAGDVTADPDAFYVNVHTALNPGGEIRGQLFPATDDDLQAVLSGEAEPDGGDPDASGFAIVYATGVADQLCTSIRVSGLTPPVSAPGAHIHAGEAGQNGPVVLPLEHPTTSDGTRYHCDRGVDAEALAAVFASPSAHYVNLHNEPFPAGAIRGQLERIMG